MLYCLIITLSSNVEYDATQIFMDKSNDVASYPPFTEFVLSFLGYKTFSGYQIQILLFQFAVQFPYSFVNKYAIYLRNSIYIYIKQSFK